MKSAVTLLMMAVLCVNAWAQIGATAPKPSPPSSSATEKWIQEVKNPTSWLNWGADLRIRDEYLDNALSLSHQSALSEQNVIRFRSRLWTTVTPITNLSFFGRLANEARQWTKPAGFGDPAFIGERGWDWRYGIVDNLNVKWKNALNQPLTLTAGRQDIALGDYYDWWLVIDGTPRDGSWTIGAFDAIRGTYQAEEIKTSFDAVYIYQNAWMNEWIHGMGPETEYTYLTEQTEMGTILYASNKSIKNTQFDGYFIYKRDDAQLANGDSADIYSLGAKITGNFATHWKYSVEGAHQFGEKEDSIRDSLATALVRDERDLRAYGAKANLTYMVNDRLENQFGIQFERLSGDDPDTEEDEMFDILWGRWPRYSELYLYSYALETSGKIGQHNNLQRIGAFWNMVPMKNTKLSAAYNAMFAPQDIPTRTVAPGEFSGDGNFRGHYLQAALQHKFSRHVNAHLWAEFVWQRDYYETPELMTFLRAEMWFTF